MLKVAGIRSADLKGYSYSREDVSARELGNAYAQTLGQVFTHEMKPYEVELLVCEVGATLEDDELYHIFYDGVVIDEQGFSAIGGQHEQVNAALEADFDPHATLADAIKLGARVLGGDAGPLAAEQLEVAFLDRSRTRRMFRRIRNGELDGLLGA